MVGIFALFATMISVLNTLGDYADAMLAEQLRQESLFRAYMHTQVGAQAVVVYDVTHDEVLYGRHPYDRKPLASITKIMTALIGKTILPATLPVTITQRDRTEEPDMQLRTGDTWASRDLIQYFLVKSSNDGSTAICNTVTEQVKKTNANLNCISLMNEYAKNLGLKTLYFANPTGLDLSNGLPSNFGSALDVAKLLGKAYASYPGLFEVTNQPIVSFRTDKYVYEATNTDKILDEVDTVLAGKTGYTDTAGGNLAVLYEPRPGLQVAIVVLGSSRDGRFNDMLELIKRTNRYFHGY